MKGGDFKRWALRGCRIYGEDQWFFLRELAQNARDAGARNVRVDARRDADEEILTFSDDGSGMDSRHAEQFLFRLYASSKEDERGSAGQFGIGFWAVLRFGPRDVRIASNPGRAPWAVHINEAFELQREEDASQPRGTTVTLRRTALFDTEEAYLEAVGAALRRFCRYLRRNNREATALPVWFQERNLIEPIAVAGPISLRFKHGPVEGAVGLAKRPSVELFARGLPVWKGLLLDELSYRGTEHAWRSEIAQGLAPSFVLNGNRLNVVMSRNAVVDDGALAALRRHAGRALQQLVKHQLQKTLPVGPVHRFLEWLRRAVARAGRLPVVTFLPLVLALVTAFAVWYFGAQLRTFFGLSGGPAEVAETVDGTGSEAAGADGHGDGLAASPGQPPGRLPTVYRGSLVERLPTSRAIALHYSPEGPFHFKFLTATDFDHARGFVALSRTPEDIPFDPPDCDDRELLTVTAHLEETGLVSLPVPTGHTLVPHSLTVDQRPVKPAVQTPNGEPLVRLAGSMSLAYQTCSTSGSPPDLPEPPAVASALLERDVRDRLEAVQGAETAVRVAVVLEVVRAHISYDDSEAAAVLFAGLGSDSDWLAFVLDAGRGDCDVMNALAILLLREMGVPARLGIGGVGRRGRLLSGLHAWVEYYDGRWRVADASEGQAATAAPRPVGVSLGQGGAEGNSLRPGRPGAAERGHDGILSLPWQGAAGEAAAPGLEASPKNAGGSEPANHLGAVWLSCGALLLGLIGVLFLRRSRAARGSRVAESLDGEEAEALLGDMALSASLQPGAWAHAEALWGHPLLPLIGRRMRFSLRQAERQAARGHLFAGGAGDRSGLADLAAAAGTPVLDAGNRFFGRLAGQLAGIVDLDRIDALKPQIKLAVEGQGFVAEVSALLRAAAGGRAVPLVVCPGLGERPLLDVDLRGAKLPPGWKGFGRFVALRPDAELQALVRRQDGGDQGARLALVDLITRRSRYYRKDGAAVRDRSAKVLLQEERA